MPRNYFIILPEGHTEDVYKAYLSFIVTTSGKKPLDDYYPQAKYLVVFEDDVKILWGRRLLSDYQERQDFIELFIPMENV